MAAPLRLNTLAGCQDFVTNQPPPAIADQILRDQQLCRSQGLPSLVVHCLPAHVDRIARVISGNAIPLAVARMRLASIVSLIKSYLANLSRSPTTDREDSIPAHMIPTDPDYTAALKVLSYLQLPQVGICPSPSTPLESVIECLKAQLSLGADVRHAIHQQNVKHSRRCYMCRFTIASPHLLYPSLCIPCGDFNITSSSLSLPPNLELSRKTALVTGGRINLGYYTALRLLRCGAKVVVSSRYPMDAETRYLNEPDYENWKERLKIIGADFRTAKDVFSLVKVVLDCLKNWSTDDKARLDILINNAAQTLTDSTEKEGDSIQRELHLTAASHGGVLLEVGYVPRVRGGVGPHLIEPSARSGPPSDAPGEDPDEESSNKVISNGKDERSSWVQHMSEIPYEDVISAHSVNTFVPFILVREFLPYMSVTRPSSSTTENPRPAAYIVNVSSREGIFESRPGHGSKAGHHVHTNMSKAALNMLTETEAASAWRNGRVAMNTVDPGYMSADPMYMEMVGRVGEACPIGWEDGAGRVLWPIARGEGGHIIRGRFLKHFTEVNVNR
ncbi:hypothetical protein GALMADRAFT_237968 [Galerina marginata CBS 339.88]|uniref:Uncharacterized protein n=1 Tax=Galerina marginata (strain CBS 339.88) TaxID=685588 RepID=A0A067TJR9_GALM3|nr:hypothetical protein GALMADRAFT_237968 [Galerina marginata CBS 339.88]